MKKNFLIVTLLILAPLVIFYKSFSIFFAQDDYILIDKFSGSNFWINILTALTAHADTHWRPVHNLFFLISGSLFQTNFLMYHFFTFLIHIMAARMVYKISLYFLKSKFPAFVSSILYASNSSHFITLFWISGSATTIAFLLFLISFDFWIKKRNIFSLCFFVASLLASEAFVVAVSIFFFYNLLFEKKREFKWFVIISLTTLIFGLLRFVFLTPQKIYNIYNLEISKNVFLAVKYYALRITNIPDTPKDYLLLVIIFLWLVTICILLTKKFFRAYRDKTFIFFLSSAIVGLFPFVFLPSHLSPHYMNISIWSFSMIVASVLPRKKYLGIFLIFIFLLMSCLSVAKYQKNNWVVSRSNISKSYIEQIKKSNLAYGSNLIFGDNAISTSYEAYISLGTGKAINFFFKDKNYHTCFAAFESCYPLP